MFAKLFTLFVAALAALLWALRSILVDTSGVPVPHDPTTMELATMAVITLAAYGWMKRLNTIRQRERARKSFPPQPVPIRYAEAVAEAAQDESLESADHAA